MTSERCLIVVHYTGTQIGLHTPCDHLGIITKNYHCNTPKSRLTLTQIVEILLGDSENHKQVFGSLPGDAPIKYSDVVSLTLFASNPESVIPP